MSLLAVSQSFSPEPTYDEELDFLSCKWIDSSLVSFSLLRPSGLGMRLMTDIHASPPPFEFDFLLSPNPNPKDEMSTDQGSIKIEEVREREKEQEDGGDGDVSMTTGMSPPSSSPFWLFSRVSRAMEYTLDPAVYDSC
jgi:hypothetical protein